ncbi:hypothetical protein VKT23_019615 [Stygiomarasmius scandens]|uniref:Uncharacterized protein n=1 Tax=Marasmiellus scandens TaxID=2682957 RepID=A0ABR1IPT4_9AGAR
MYYLYGSLGEPSKLLMDARLEWPNISWPSGFYWSLSPPPLLSMVPKVPNPISPPSRHPLSSPPCPQHRSLPPPPPP